MNIMGVDPGLSGALVSINDNELMVYDMPTYEITVSKRTRRKVDIKRMIEIFRLEKPHHVFVEEVWARPGNGAVAAFSFGWSCCAIEAALVACDIPSTYVTPNVWKKAMECPADKGLARQRATHLLPQFAHNWDRKKDDGRAEAALIALYGYRKTQ